MNTTSRLGFLAGFLVLIAAATLSISVVNLLRANDWGLPMAGKSVPVAQSAELPTPAVALRIRVPEKSALGEELQYAILVENVSRADAHHVFVRCPLPANAKFVRTSPEPASKAAELVWKLDTLEPGAKREIGLVVIPTEATEINLCARVQLEHGKCVSTKVLKPSIHIERSGPTQAQINQTLTYKLTVTNTGEADLTGVFMTDALPAGLEHESGLSSLTWEVGPLAAGQSQFVEYRLMARKGGRLCSKLSALGSAGVKDEQESCVTVTAPKLSLSITGPKRKYLNYPAIYQIVIRNDGDAPLTNLRVLNPIPRPTRLLRASEGAQIEPENVRWMFESLGPGMSEKLDLVLQSSMTGQVCDRVTVAADGGFGEHAEQCTDFVGIPALSLHVEDTEDPIEILGATSYDIAVRNPGTSQANNVQITASIPPQMELSRATGPSAFKQNGAQLTFDLIPVAAGTEVHYRVEVLARQAGEAHFKVELRAKELEAGGPVVQEETTTIYPTLPASLRRGGKRATAIKP